MKKFHEIPWEQAGEDSHSVLEDRTLPTKAGTLGLKMIAVSKMMDVSVISGDFRSETVVFVPWIKLLIDCKSSLKFYGAYMSAYIKETRDAPDICLRTCSWEQAEDDVQYEGAANKIMYILSDKQLKAKITFATLRNFREIKQLIDDAITMGSRGLALKDCQRKNPTWMKLDCEMVSHYSPWSAKFSYYLSDFRNDIFENWVSCWHTTLDGIDLLHASSPDGTVRISYDMSLPERISSLADG